MLLKSEDTTLSRFCRLILELNFQQYNFALFSDILYSEYHFINLLILNSDSVTIIAITYY